MRNPSLNLPSRIQAVKLDGGYAGGLRALCALTDLELNTLVLVEGAESAGLDLGVVDKDVAFSVVRGNEAEAFSALNHLTVPSAIFVSPHCGTIKSGTPRAGLGYSARRPGIPSKQGLVGFAGASRSQHVLRA